MTSAVIESLTGVRKPWAGKVHNPYKLWLEDQARRKNITTEQFQKQLKENVVARQDAADQRLDAMQEQLGAIAENLKALTEALGGKN